MKKETTLKKLVLYEGVFKDNIFLISIKIYDSNSALTIKINKQRHYLFFYIVFVFVYCLVLYSDMVGNLIPRIDLDKLID